jgi:3-isopropylmalate dehydrogenase
MLSFSMMLRYSFDLAEEADLVDNAVKRVLDAGLRTGDIMQPGMRKVSTVEMGDAILKEVERQAA